MDPGHPESPDRLRAVYQMLEEEQMRGGFGRRNRSRPGYAKSWRTSHTSGTSNLVALRPGKPHVRLGRRYLYLCQVL